MEHTNNWESGNNKKNFYVPENDITKITGKLKWSNSTFEALQFRKQERIWSGKVSVVEATEENGGAHVHAYPNSLDTHWEINDTIVAKSCYETGNNYI